jgi:hypothetical protein
MSNSKKEYNSEWAKANRDKRNASNRKWRAKNIEREAARNRAYKEANRGAICATQGKRRAAEIQRTPAWAELSDIRELYVFAGKMDGDFHVDHIIPLQGKLVSGLHVYDNLQILPALDNCSKGNSYQ